MKKYLFIIVFAIATFMVVANVSAASINSQSVDVTVGEVDQIDIDNENPDADAPNTGLFGPNSDSVTIVVATAFLTIPIAVILACLFRYTHRKHTK